MYSFSIIIVFLFPIFASTQYNRYCPPILVDGEHTLTRQYDHFDCMDIRPQHPGHVLTAELGSIQQAPCEDFNAGNVYFSCPPEQGYKVFQNVTIHREQMPYYSHIVFKEVLKYREGCDFKSPIGAFKDGVIILTLNNSTGRKAEIVRNNRLEIAACDENEIILPTQNTPSCHSSNSSQCGWKTFDGIESVRERPELVGNQFKIVSESATLISHPLNDSTDSVCILLELLNSKRNQKPNIELFILANDKTLLLKNNFLQEESTWHTEKITADIPEDVLSIENYQLILKLKNAKGSYLNKIYGCNPYSDEGRALVVNYEDGEDGRIPVEEVSTECISHPSLPGVFCQNGDEGRALEVNYEDEYEDDRTPTPSPFLQNSLCLNGGIRKEDGSTKCFCPSGFRGTFCEIGIPEDTFCLNGGTLQSDSTCSCPPGFGGNFCEIACGSNKWGPNCENECSGRNGDCEGVKFCTLDTNKCQCASGFTSRKCDRICANYSYGADCKEKCGHCKDNSSCNTMTGHCDDGCLEGYKPPFCKKKFIHAVVEPEVMNLDFNEATIGINYQNLKGEGTPFLFQVYYKVAIEDFWKESELMKIGTDLKITETLKNLVPGVKYQAKIIVRDKQANGYENVPAVSFTTNCTMSHNFTIMKPVITKESVMLKWRDQTLDEFKCRSVEKQVELFTGLKKLYYITYDNFMELKSLQAGTKYRVRVRAIGQTNGKISRSVTFITLPDEFAKVSNLKTTSIGPNDVQIEWTPGNKDTTNTYEIKAKCLKILSRTTIKSCPPLITKSDIQQNQTLVGELKANTLYELSVRELPSAKVVWIKFITQEAVPEVEPRKSDMTVTNSTAEMFLLPPTDCYDCNGDLIGYFYEVFEPDNNIIQSNKTIFSNIFIEGLKPLTTYQIRIYNYNSVGYNKKSYLEIKFTTLSSVPDAVQDLVIYKKARDMLGLRWSPPENAGRNLLEFKLEDGNRSFVEDLKPCPSWPQQFCYTITDLQSDTAYNLSVSSRISNSSDYGSSEYIIGVTREEAPEKVINLKVSAIGEESATVEWEPPRFHNGIIRSYLVKVEQTDSYNKKDCCKKYPLREILVSEEKDKYQVQINDLKPASTYALSVMAETVWLGPSLRVTFNTRPSSSMGKIKPPSVIANSSVIVWQKKNHSETLNIDYSQLVIGNLLLVLTDDSEDNEEASSLEQEVKNITSLSPIKLLKEIYHNRFYIAAEYNEGEEVMLGDGAQREGKFGTVTNLPLTPGKTYTLIAAQVLSYCELFNVAVLISEPFLI